MGTLTQPAAQGGATKFDWIMAALSTWFVIGAYVDGWAHNNLDRLETFLTPWHLLLYSGYFVTGFMLLWTAWSNKNGPWSSWKSWIPAGYAQGIIGTLIFFFAAGFDWLWHVFFGIEKNVEALFSPTHLMLSVGAFLMVSGPFVAAWRRSDSAKGLKANLPMLVSLLLMLSLATFMTQFISPVRPRLQGAVPATRALVNDSLIIGASGFLMYAVLLVGAFLVAMRHFRLPMGALTLIAAVNGLGMSFQSMEFRPLIAAIAAGIVADICYSRHKDMLATSWHPRLFGAVVAGSYVLAYMIVFALTGGVWWSIHMWTGAIVMTALVGSLVSFVAYGLAPAKTAAV